MRAAGRCPGLVRTGATFEDAAAEYLRYIEHDRGRKPSTVRGYRSAITAHLLPAFGTLPVEAVAVEVIEQWVVGFDGSVRTRGVLARDLDHGYRTASRITNRAAGADQRNRRPDRSALRFGRLPRRPPA
jgi:hypothetical protein